MKKLLIVLILAMAVSVSASPFLKSDQGTADVWQVEVDGTLSEVYVGDTVNYDLVSITTGSHVIRARFGTAWVVDEGGAAEWSEWTPPFGFTKPPKPDAPTGQKIEP